MTATQPSQTIVDYDSDGYDYRGFWHGRDYEQWAESHALRRLLAQLGRPDWFVDFGGGFGRNAEHYRDRAQHSVLVDYSVTNLTRAEQLHEEYIDEGRMFLVRADLNHLPFVDGAFDTGMVIRVLHHLPQLERTLSEMARVLSRQWILDVPIKHHLFGMARAAVQRDLRGVRDDAPRITGDSRYPFYNFKLSAVRRHLAQQHWTSTVAASVNNFRRWDRRLPHSAVHALNPVIHALEKGAQQAGRGWWGPTQLVVAKRRPPLVAALRHVDDRLADPDALLAPRMCCPTCHGGLEWTSDAARCVVCDLTFAHKQGYWDFVA